MNYYQVITKSDQYFEIPQNDVTQKNIEEDGGDSIAMYRLVDLSNGVDMADIRTFEAVVNHTTDTFYDTASGKDITYNYNYVAETPEDWIVPEPVSYDITEEFTVADRFDVTCSRSDDYIRVDIADKETQAVYTKGFRHEGNDNYSSFIVKSVQQIIKDFIVEVDTAFKQKVIQMPIASSRHEGGYV